MLVPDKQVFPRNPDNQTAVGYGVTFSSEATNAARELWLYRIADALYPKFGELSFTNRPTVRNGVG
jgi:hypothetical protein